MKYFWIVIKHKWYVLLAGLRLKLPLWRALTHDLSKFTRAELPHYNRQFCGDKGDPEGFARAWLHHYHRNDHHWEAWIVESIQSHTDPTRDSCIVDNCLQMPLVCVMEMFADWLGASKAYTGSWDMDEWFDSHIEEMRFHPKTRDLVIYMSECKDRWWPK